MKRHITKNNILKLFSFLPTLLIMSMIFSFSAQNSSESASISELVTAKFIEIIDRIFALDLTFTQTLKATSRIHYFIRKMGHFSEYFILGASITLPLYTIYRIRGKRIFLFTLCFCFLFASTDEIHQLFVDGRIGSIKDVLIDTCGAFTGILSMQTICYIVRKCIFEPLQMHHFNALNRAR